MTETFDGFSQRYADFPDYILKITRDIWEGRAIGSLNETYAADLPVRFPQGISMGNQATIEGTMATLAEFPDRTLYGEDVIWSGDAETGYLSSHRITSTGTCKGRGPFCELIAGARGKTFRIRAIADCAAKADVIDDEWLIRDSGSLVRQLGGEPQAYAQALLDAGMSAEPFTPDNDVPGPYLGRGNDSEWGTRYEHVLERIMAKDFDVIEREYDRACFIETPGGARGVSWEAIDGFWLPLRSSFPRAQFKVHHRIGREDAMLSPRAAIRWSLWGDHTGWGAFGRPTGARVHVMGISHVEFGPYGIRREWNVFDEIPIWTQILNHEARK